MQHAFDSIMIVVVNIFIYGLFQLIIAIVTPRGLVWIYLVRVLPEELSSQYLPYRISIKYLYF